MARLPRFYLPGQPLHVIQRGNHRGCGDGEDSAAVRRVGEVLVHRVGRQQLNAGVD